MRLVATLLAAAFVGCTPSSTPTPVPPTPTRTPTPSITLPIGTEAGEIPVEPCANVAETTDPFFVQEDEAGLPSEPTQAEDEGVEGPEIPPVPINPEGKPVDVPLRDATVPSAYDPTDPRFITRFADHQFHDRTITTAEPEVAVNGDRVLVTWNRGAAMSSDFGATFSPVNPLDYGIFSNEDYGFCCDQLARYDAGHGLWLWVLQYEFRKPGDPNSTRPNRIRLGVAKGDAAFDARSFSYVDLIPQELGYSEEVWLDRTNLSVTRQNLFLSINAYSGALEGAAYHGAIVLRIPLDQLAEGNTISPTCLFPRLTYQTQAGQRARVPNALFPIRGATDTMYLAMHFDDTTLAVWRWPDEASNPSQHWVRNRHPGGSGFVSFPSRSSVGKFSCPHESSPANSDWCAHGDDRVASGWKAGGQIGFAWSAGQPAQDKYPFMASIVLDEARLPACQIGECVLGRPSLAFDGAAIQYISIAPNADGELGGVALFGGGAFDLGCALLVHDSVTSTDPSSDLYWDVGFGVSSAKDVHPPSLSGDYLGIWPDGGGPHTWSAACMTMSGTAAARQSTVHFLRFGRLANDPGR